MVFLFEKDEAFRVETMNSNLLSAKTLRTHLGYHEGSPMTGVQNSDQENRRRKEMDHGR